MYALTNKLCVRHSGSLSLINPSFCLSQSSMGSLASDSLVKRVYQCMCSIDHELAGSGKTDRPATSGVSRDQLMVFLADTLRGTAEERAPLVLAMSHNAEGPATAVTCDQVAEVSRGIKQETIYQILWLWFMSCLFHVSAVPTRPDFCCSSDSGPQRAPAGLEAGENG